MTDKKPKPFNLTVTIKPLDSGGLTATHKFASDADDAAAAELPGQGITHIAHGLFLEAVRREAYISALTALAADEDLLQKYSDGDASTKLAMETRLADAVTEVFQKGCQKVGPGVANGILRMMTSAEG